MTPEERAQLATEEAAGHQPRERSVPCGCGGGHRTWSVHALCPRVEVSCGRCKAAAAELAARVPVAA